jgi:hypothetical protein
VERAYVWTAPSSDRHKVAFIIFSARDDTEVNKKIPRDSQG